MISLYCINAVILKQKEIDLNIVRRKQLKNRYKHCIEYSNKMIPVFNMFLWY